MQRDVMKNITVAVLKAALLRITGGAIFTADWQLNIVGIRCATGSNTFDDVLAVFFYVAGREYLYLFPMTTDPGFFYRQNPVAPAGCAVLVPGVYLDAYQIGLHRGAYTALVQRKPVTVWRDNDRDVALNENSPIDTGLFGINIHHANPDQESQQVDKWSAGCQVLANPNDFDVLMALAGKHHSLHGNKFTYTLLPEGWL